MHIIFPLLLFLVNNINVSDFPWKETVIFIRLESIYSPCVQGDVDRNISLELR